MKVLKNGSTKRKSRAICPICGCVFEYDGSDIHDSDNSEWEEGPLFSNIGRSTWDGPVDIINKVNTTDIWESLKYYKELPSRYTHLYTYSGYMHKYRYVTCPECGEEMEADNTYIFAFPGLEEKNTPIALATDFDFYEYCKNNLTDDEYEEFVNVIKHPKGNKLAYDNMEYLTSIYANCVDPVFYDLKMGWLNNIINYEMHVYLLDEKSVIKICDEIKNLNI